jgi:hypothetical protein
VEKARARGPSVLKKKMPPNNVNSDSDDRRLHNGLSVEKALELLAIATKYIDDPTSTNETAFLTAFEESLKSEQLITDQIDLLREQIDFREQIDLRGQIRRGRPFSREAILSGVASSHWQTFEIVHFIIYSFWPAFVTDSMLYLNSVNNLFMTLFGVSTTFFTEVKSKPAKRHLLYFFFHPQIREVFVEGWKDLVIFYMFLFRIRTKEKAKSQEYFDLIHILTELPDFREIWELTETLTYLPKPPPQIFRLKSSELGEVSCFHSEVLMPILYTAPIQYPDPIFFATYTPADIKSAQLFTKLDTTPGYLIFDEGEIM